MVVTTLTCGCGRRGDCSFHTLCGSVRHAEVCVLHVFTCLAPTGTRSQCCFQLEDAKRLLKEAVVLPMVLPEVFTGRIASCIPLPPPHPSRTSPELSMWDVRAASRRAPGFRSVISRISSVSPFGRASCRFGRGYVATRRTADAVEGRASLRPAGHG